MAGTDNRRTALGCSSAHKILRLLAEQAATPEARVVHRQVARLLDGLESSYAQALAGYAAVLQTLVRALGAHIGRDSPLLLELDVFGKSLEPPLSLDELDTLRTFANQMREASAALQPLETETLRVALAPFLGAPPGPGMDGSDGPPDAQAGPAPAAVEQQVTSVYRQRLDQQRRDILEIQNILTGKIRDASRQHQEFGVLLDMVLGELRHAQGIEDLQRLRESVAGEVERLLDSHGSLTSMLDDAQSFLQLVETSSKKLSEELDQVRVLSLTDELTGLPNRRAFLRRLEDEMGRAQRYGSPLTLAMIDLDEFKAINDSFGHSTGDEILRCYAREILSIFRRYDLVARYGGEEFAVLLPNTDLDGAVRALNKVSKQAAELCYTAADGQRLSVPTFSAGVAAYRPGETAEALIGRADAVLYRAKRRGRNRIEEDRPAAAGKRPTSSAD